MTGFTWITALAVLAGLLVHALKQIESAHGTDLTRCVYFKREWPELLAGVICGFVLWGGSPELGRAFPELARFGFGAAPTVLSSFMAGYVGNSLADLLGNRIRAIAQTSVIR